ncbi:LysR family transcriptional regulator [Glaciimonas sp. GG7]
MKFQQLRTFVQVAEKGSVRAAADSLNVSATAASQSLKELEHNVGFPLFTRHSQGVVTTILGRQFLEHARLILGQVDRAEKELVQLRGQVGGSLAIGVTPWVSQSILPYAIRAFRLVRPDVRLDVYETLGRGHQPLREGTLDIVIGMPPAPQHAAGFKTQNLFECAMAIVGRMGHPLSDCTSMAELWECDWLLTLRQDVIEQPLLDMLAPFGVQPCTEKIHLARSTLSVLAMLEGSNMLTVCPWPLVETPLMRNRILALPIRNPLPVLTTSLVTRRGDALTAVAKIFIDCFMDATRECQHSVEVSLRRIMNSVEDISGKIAAEAVGTPPDV